MAHVRKQMISFFMTTKCNLDCIYCYTPKYKQIKPEDQSIDLDFARKGIDDFFRDNPSRYIRFYGIGEPTIEIEKIKAITEYARLKSGDKDVYIELQSNGCFPESTRKWIAENVNWLWISCDGPADVHNKQRPFRNGGATSEKVEETIKSLQNIDTLTVGVRVTLMSDMISQQRKIVDYFESIGVRYINVLPVFEPEEGSENPSYKWDAMDFAENFYDAHMYAESKGIWYNTMCIVNFDETTRIACRSCTPCPHLTTDGYVSCCDFTQLGPEYIDGPLSQLIYGKYDKEKDMIYYDEDAIHKIRSRCAENLKKETCKDCKYVYNCAGGCMGQVVNETGDLMGRIEDNCKIVQYLGERIPRNKGLFPAFHS